MVSINDSSMQIVNFRLQATVCKDMQERARTLGYTTLSEYLRTLVHADIYGGKLLDNANTVTE